MSKDVYMDATDINTPLPFLAISDQNYLSEQDSSQLFLKIGQPRSRPFSKYRPNEASQPY